MNFRDGKKQVAGQFTHRCKCDTKVVDYELIHMSITRK